jgi:nucleotide-binding universal stress UspA family protein
MLKKILVPMDGSTLSEKVLPYALKLATRLGLQVTLLQVIEGKGHLEKDVFETGSTTQGARAYLARVSDFLTSHDDMPLISSKQLETKVLHGDPAEVICRYAAEENFDLVTMTTHGQPQTQQYFLGSVTLKVLHHLNVPVLLIRPYWQGSPANYGLSDTLACLNEPFGRKFLANGVRLVLPLDMTDKAETSLELSFELAQKLDATLYLLKVNNPVLYSEPSQQAGGAPALPDSDLLKRDEANLYLKQIEGLAEKHEVEAVKIVLSGNPATEIVAFAELMEPDALVMATHTFGEADQARMPSLTHEVMRRSHLPVFMVPMTLQAAAKVQVDPALV